MISDRITKLLLALVAIGLFANAPRAWLAEAHAAPSIAKPTPAAPPAEVDVMVSARSGDNVFFVHNGKLYLAYTNGTAPGGMSVTSTTLP